MTQHQKILQLHENREWICQAEYRNISWCPHKRRKDIEEGRAKGIPARKYHFESKDCEHGIKGSRDYLLVRRVDVKEDFWGPSPIDALKPVIDARNQRLNETIEQKETLNL